MSIETREKYLREMLSVLSSTLIEYEGSSDDKEYEDLPIESQLELDLNQIVMVNTVQWIQMLLRGENPNESTLKIALDKAKAAMLAWHEIKENREEAVCRIEKLFDYIYKL